MIHLIKTVVERFSFLSCLSDNAVWSFEKTVVNFQGNIEDIII